VLVTYRFFVIHHERSVQKVSREKFRCDCTSANNPRLPFVLFREDGSREE
jgi:hypothetical protein